MGVVWIIGRLIYSTGYMADPSKRSTGYLIQLLAGAALLFGALGKIVYSLATGGIFTDRSSSYFKSMRFQIP